MNNWMEKYEREKDKQMEDRLNRDLKTYLNLLNQTFDDKKIKKLIELIVEIYDELRINACEYDENDYKSKKAELSRIRYQLMSEQYMEEKEAQSWNEYREEEMEEGER